MREIESRGDPVTVAAPSVAELLLGAQFKGGKVLRDGLELLSHVEILDIDEAVAAEAGRLGAELLRLGEGLPTTDLLIGATARMRQQILVTRDDDFLRIPGLAVERY